MHDPETFLFGDDGAIPNSRLPVLVYRAALPADPAAIERVFAANLWPPAWRDGVFGFHHFHANTHEALGVASGSATVLFGGPGGCEVTVTAGDVVVIPAGVGHCNVGQTADLVMVGAYPDNAPMPDRYQGDPKEREFVMAKIAGVPAPGADPVAGHEGPMARLWPIGPGEPR